jgi:hypothetical protein
MLDSRQSPPPRFPTALAGALERAAGAIARLDSALARHPLCPAWAYRARLDAVRRQAMVDGQAIDPWHLAALIEGVRFRLGRSPALIDRGAVFAAAHHAFDLYRWFSAPDEAQQAAIAEAAAHLDSVADGHSPLLGARSLHAEVPWAREVWVVRFLAALAAEAEDGNALIATIERHRFAARRAVAGRRRDSRAAAAIDILAAAPLVSATSLGQALGMATKNATRLLEGFVVLGIASEVTHRSKRRLYGLKHLAPLRGAAAPPRRPLLGRRPGRPSAASVAATAAGSESPPAIASLLARSPPLPPLERRKFEFGELDRWRDLADQAIRRAQHLLEGYAAAPRSPTRV